MSGDPFGTEALRASVLGAWTSSPTRFREDANAEEDLYLGGYRDRLLVELAQNAADAAGSDGTLRVDVVDGELRAANTGRPLDAPGVAALASLRASAKQRGVGQFGLGFAAVLAVTDEPAVLSQSGGVAFSAARTTAAIADHPDLAARAAERDGRVPVLRLVWPVDEAPPAGFATEVRLPLRDGVDGQALLDGFAREAADLLLALPALTRIEIAGTVWTRTDEDDRVTIHGPGEPQSWLVHRVSGELSAEVVATLGVEARSRAQWSVAWALRLDADGAPSPLAEDVLHAPTPTDERMSLPARLVATVPIEPSRRRARPGPAADEVLTAAAAAYPGLVAKLPAKRRTGLVPRAGFPLSEVDDRVRELVRTALRRAEWLPAAGSGWLTPARARVLDVAAPGLADLLSEVIPDLVDGALSEQAHAGALAALEVPRMRLSEVVAAITGTSRPPAWWHKLYTALAPVADADATAREELGGLPVPMADGRTLPGPRGAVRYDGDPELLALLAHTDLGALRVVHPDAAHPVLDRLGAQPGTAADLLDSLQDAVERSMDDAESGIDVAGLAPVVLRLLSESGAHPRPWLGALALPDSVGDWRRADELALPGSPLLDVLDPDSPIGVLSSEVAETWPTHVLVAAGVLDAFALVVDESPTGPDHDLADEADWWDTYPTPPTRVVGIRDLDLVAPDAWPRALRLLAANPDTWRALVDPIGYSAWWIGRHALLSGAAPITWRMPDATALAGLYDPLPDTGVDPRVLLAVGVRTDLAVHTAEDARDLLDRLADPDRAIPRASSCAPTAPSPRPSATTSSTSTTWTSPRSSAPSQAPSPTTAPSSTARGCCPSCPTTRSSPRAPTPPWPKPWQTSPTSPGVGGGSRRPGLHRRVRPLVRPGRRRRHLRPPRRTRPPSGPIVHDKLTIRTDTGDHQVPWWITPDGVAHCEDTPEALARTLAWTTDRWPDRHTFTALIEDPALYLR
ncbi:sacsin N-terminal ATP-binding-like domain-containing protein [Actinokineospora soli]|uniref:Sacsin N-terminal ATP-binding-like domain-containing protein n=1 Tax=Actinokineospora soli TaxID=1048753 RepID=A0ABW2THV8_9PSEU